MIAKERLLDLKDIEIGNVVMATQTIYRPSGPRVEIPRALKIIDDRQEENSEGLLGRVVRLGEVFRREELELNVPAVDLLTGIYSIEPGANILNFIEIINREEFPRMVEDAKRVKTITARINRERAALSMHIIV